MSSLFAFQPSVHRWVKIDDLSQLPLQVERENVLAWTQCPRYLSIGIPILEVNRYFHRGFGCLEIIYDERVFRDCHGACTPKLGNNHFHRAVVELVFHAVELHSRFDPGLTAASTTSSQEQDSDKQSRRQRRQAFITVSSSLSLLAVSAIHNHAFRHCDTLDGIVSAEDGQSPLDAVGHPNNLHAVARAKHYFLRFCHGVQMDYLVPKTDVVRRDLYRYLPQTPNIVHAPGEMNPLWSPRLPPEPQAGLPLIGII